MSTILVVDDDPQILQLVDFALTTAGHTVVGTPYPQEAVRLAEQHHAVAVVLDLMMPSMSGFEVLKRLQANPATASIPVLILSALGDGSDRVKGLEAGADDYLAKPFVPEELVLRVARLARERAEAEDLRGRLGVVSVPEVLQILSQNQATGTLEVTGDQQRGEILLLEGQAHEARIGELEGREAVLAMFSFNAGFFRFRASTVLGAAPDGTPPMSFTNLIFTAAWLKDELSRRPVVDADDQIVPLIDDDGPPPIPTGFEALPFFGVWSAILERPGLTVAELQQRLAVAPGMIRLTLAVLAESCSIKLISGDAEESGTTELGGMVSRYSNTLASGEGEPPEILVIVDHRATAALLEMRQAVPAANLEGCSGSLTAAWQGGRAAKMVLSDGKDRLVVHLAAASHLPAAIDLSDLLARCLGVVLWCPSGSLDPTLLNRLENEAAEHPAQWGLVLTHDPDAAERAAPMVRASGRWSVHCHAPKDLTDLLTLFLEARPDSTNAPAG